jgi:hypothetical protein
MSTQNVPKRTSVQTLECPNLASAPATVSGPSLMVQKYGADAAARTCACCYFLAYRTLPPELRKRPAYPNVYPCTTAVDWVPDQPACKLWRPAPQVAIRPRRSK